MIKVEPNGFNTEMTDEQLRQLWDPTSAAWERWVTFVQVPKVLYLASMTVQLSVTVAFVILQQLNQMENPTHHDRLI